MHPSYKEKDGIICDGSIRSGKTTVMSLSFAIWAMTTLTERTLRYVEKPFNHCEEMLLNN